MVVDINIVFGMNRAYPKTLPTKRMILQISLPIKRNGCCNMPKRVAKYLLQSNVYVIVSVMS